jgi:uroporphyrinogen decarboxylase
MDNSMRYLRAARGEKLSVPPVWLMRQAGRYLPEYLAVRAQHDFLTVCREPELACEVTLQPIRRFHFDAAILFSDILLPLVPLGMELTFGKNHGPQIANPLRSKTDVDNLKTFNPREHMANVLTAIRMIRRELPPDVALIGFVGAPFTLAAYMIEGGKPEPFANLKSLQYNDPHTFQLLLQKLAEMDADYLAAMVEAGADAVQVFDTWAGILPEREFRAINLPVLQSIFSRLKPLNVPMTYFVLNGGHLLKSVRECGCTVAGIDWRTPLTQARAVLGDEMNLQGNLDPTVLLANESVIREHARRIVNEGNSDGHIFNLGHGILPNTPIHAVEILLDEVRKDAR